MDSEDTDDAVGRVERNEGIVMTTHIPTPKVINWKAIAKAEQRDSERLRDRVTKLEAQAKFQDKCWKEVSDALEGPGDKNMAEWAQSVVSSAKADKLRIKQLEAVQTPRTIDVSDLSTFQSQRGDQVFEHMRRTARALESKVNDLEADRLTPAITPNPFRLNPEDGTMGYVLILAQYSGELDEWVLMDDGDHQGWRTASLIEVE